ncbi:uncharacterized protein LOC131615090 [Vicia villosa]|uniref:uncharacterized protein LOC131615090 n=1 Tax=Vicia villosa TaxID=3911 RepID=UPI00273C534A|nr:uncharacterized protein LOC131615090 [Vicia villosa]
MKLVDIPIIGGKFTWFNSNGKSMSRIDRLFLSESFIEDWNIEGKYIGAREISDHAPIWIKNNRKDWGPKPFKFNNGWLKHPDFGSFVKEEWSKIVVIGRGDFCLVEKLEILKGRLAWWNKSVFGWIDLNIKSAQEELSFLDDLFASFAGTVRDEEVRRRAKVVEVFWENLFKKESLLRLKSRQSWLAEGDNNTRFFHCSLKGRRSKNKLCSLQYNGRRLEEVSEIKEAVFNHFNDFFTEPEHNRPVCFFPNLKFLYMSESLELESPFSLEELKEAL